MLFVLIVLATFSTHVLADDCLLYINYSYVPMILDEKFHFITTYQGQYVEIKEGTLFYLQCPNGTTNNFFSETEGDAVICIAGSNVLNTRTGQVADFRRLRCRPKIWPSTVRKLDETCENNYTKIAIGLEIQEVFIPSITVCFNEIDLTPFYVEYYKTTYDVASSTTDNVFVDGGNFFPVDLDDLIRNYYNILTDLGVSSNEPFIVRQLVNPGSFFDPIKASYDYITTVPGWANIGNGVSCYSEAPPNSVVYSGTAGVNRRKNTAGEETKIYLYNRRIPIPKWTWCVAYNTSADVDGYFKFSYTDRGSYSTYREEWRNEICDNNDVKVIEFGYIVGVCPFADVKDPLLINFVDNKWPGARRKILKKIDDWISSVDLVIW